MVALTLSLSAFAACAFSLFLAGPNPLPYKSGSRILNAGIWTVHFGIDNKGRDSQKGMTTLIKWVEVLHASKYVNSSFDRDLELDIVGLLETDLHVSLLFFSKNAKLITAATKRIPFGNRDL